MDRLIQDLINKKINEEAMAIEKVYFTKTDKTVNPRKENPFKYIKGRIPVLVSAPHSVRHIRQKKIKQSDIFTGSLACLLNNLTGSHVLAVTALYGGDPNYDLPCIYKDQLKEICQNNKISFLIDLHGVTADREFDIDIGTMHDRSLLNKEEIIKLLTKSFTDAGIYNLSFNQLPASKQNTVIKYAATQLGIPSIQLEINRKFRAPNQNPTGYCRLLAAITTIINHSNHYLHGRK